MTNNKLNSIERELSLNKKLGHILADISIVGLAGHVELCFNESVPTAVWIYNLKKKEFTIKISANLVESMTDEEIKLILQHELLHHYKYQNCDTRNPIMSNIVLDTAINKMLYLYQPESMCSMSEKIYLSDGQTMEQLSATPIVLACPILTAENIQNIPDEDIKNAYIDIWGSRQTLYDFDTTIPDPTELFFKLIKIINEDQAMNSPFGDDSDDEDDGNGENGGGDSDNDDSSNDDNDADGNGDSKDKGKSDKNKNKSKKRKRCKIIDDKDENDEANNDNAGDNSKADDEDKNDNDKSEGGDNDEDDGDNAPSGYTDIEKDVEKLNDEINGEVGKKNGAGSSSGISICDSTPIEINVDELEQQILELRLAETIEEVGHAISDVTGSNIEELPYIIRPTRTTLTYIACGITDVMPIYWNNTNEASKPKIACYIDVSGSMGGLTQLVQAIINKISDLLPSVMFAFDTSILPIDSKLFECKALLGGGTSFNNVFQHINMSIDKKAKWLKNFIKQNKNSNISQYCDASMLDSEIMYDDVSTVFILTDGDDSICENYQDAFKASGKQLIVLQILTNSFFGESSKNVFTGVANQIIYINEQGEIIK